VANNMLNPVQREQVVVILRRFDGLIGQAEELLLELRISGVPGNDASVDQLTAHIRDLQAQRDWFAGYLKGGKA
jgi:hypothetical protein